MNEIKIEHQQNILPFHPLSTMITYLQFGIIFTVIQIDIGWLKYITTSVGILLLYLGLRLLKNANVYFRLAYQLSIVNIFIHIISLMMLATPYYLNVQNLYYFGSALTYVMTYLIYLGLKKEVKNQEDVKQFLWTYIILECSMIIGMLMQGLFMYLCLLIALLSFCYLIYNLSQIKKDILQYNYHIQLSSIQMSTLKTTILYFLTILVLISSSFFIATSFQYQQTKETYEIDNRFKENRVEQVIKYHDMKLKVSYAISKREDIGCFQHIVEYEWLELPTYTYMLDTICFQNIHGMAVTNHIIQNYICNEDDMNYQSKLETTVKDNFFLTTNVESLKTYINPFGACAKGTIVFWVNDHYEDTELEFPILFGVKNKFVFPYHEQYDQGIEIYALCEGTQVKKIQTQDVYN